ASATRLELGAGELGRQEHAERRTTAAAVFNPRTPSVELGESSHEREADPMSFFPGRTTRERLEDVFLDLVGNAGASIVDGDLNAAGFRQYLYDDVFIALAEFQRVADQVFDDAFGEHRINFCQSRPAYDTDGRLGAGDPAHDLLGNIPDVDRRSLRLEESLTDAIEVEQIRKQPLETPTVHDHSVEQLVFH